MFSDDQLEKISFFASVTKITNECFKKCIKLNDTVELSKNEISCLKNCSTSFIKLREFIEIQIFEDYESIKNKNKIIHDNET